MRDTCEDKGVKGPFAKEAVLKAVSNVDETRGRLNLAGLGLAAPLMSARAGHAAREAARAQVDPHATEEERVQRAAVHERATGNLALLHKETVRAQVTPAAPKDLGNAVLYGRIVECGKPIARGRIAAEAPGVRLEHACADGEGRYALEVPGDVEVTFAVARATGPIVHRDRCPTRLRPGQRLYREYDLDTGEPPCEPPEDEPKYVRTRKEQPKDTSTPPKATRSRTAKPRAAPAKKKT